MNNSYGQSSTYEYVEDSIRQRLVEWMNRIIEDEKLPFDRADAQIEIRLPSGEKRRFPDIVIWEKRLQKAVCIIELKQPYWSAFDWRVISDALDKATKSSPQIPYFATWNVNDLILWKTFEEEALSFEERRKGIYSFANIRSLREIDYPEVENKIKESLRIFLIDLVDIVYKKKLLPKIPVDEYFIYSLRKVIDTFYQDVSIEIKREMERDSIFRKELNEWFILQGWTPPSTNEDFEKVARQYLYLLVNKIMFYNVLRKSFNLKPINIPSDVSSNFEFKMELQKYFELAEKISGDYETIFGLDFLEKIPIPDNIILSFSSFINGLSRYDFSKIGYKDLGHIFDRLIPEHHRHMLGQYFTNPDVVDIINTFCIRDANAKVADFGCGAGTFLVRAYARIKHLNPLKTHRETLRQLLGVDISKFAAHLAMINLAIRDLSSPENYPQIIPMDFFKIKPATMEEWVGINKKVITTLSGEEKEIEIPPVFDAVVGNPPYTRQEEIEAYIKDYKKFLQNTIENDWVEKVKLGGRAGIYAYFFIHGLRFLREKGRFGYITSNSWLDVDYGKYLQEFFLKNTKIIAIIEPKERIFPDADINTVITILERCSDEKKRMENKVKFVKLKIPLKELIPNTDEENRFRVIEEFIELVDGVQEFYEDKRMRIYPIKQKELWKEGYDEVKNKYEGSKWGKYLRAPEIFFKILEKGKGLLIPLKQVVRQKRGFTTGADEFFYLTGEKTREWNLEPVFLKPVIKTPRDSRSIMIKASDLAYKVLLVHDDKLQLKDTNVLRYIEWGEAQAFHRRPTCRSRGRWYDLGERSFDRILWPRLHYESHIIFYGEEIYADDGFFELLPFKEDDKFVVLACLNSTLTALFKEIYGSVGLGQGALYTSGIDIRNILTINPDMLEDDIKQKLESALMELWERDIESIFDELGANSPEQCSLNKIKPDRRKLDKIIMGEILGLSDEEQLEIYKAVIELVRERIERAKSVKKRKKKSGVNAEVLAKGILNEIDLSRLKHFPEDYLRDLSLEYDVIKVPSGKPKLITDLTGSYIEVDNEKIRFETLDEARYVYYAMLNGYTRIRIPKDRKLIREIVEEYSKIFKGIRKEIDDKLESQIPDRKIREKVRVLIENRLIKMFNKGD